MTVEVHATIGGMKRYKYHYTSRRNGLSGTSVFSYTEAELGIALVLAVQAGLIITNITEYAE